MRRCSSCSLSFKTQFCLNLRITMQNKKWAWKKECTWRLSISKPKSSSIQVQIQYWGSHKALSLGYRPCPKMWLVCPKIDDPLGFGERGRVRRQFFFFSCLYFLFQTSKPAFSKHGFLAFILSQAVNEISIKIILKG